MVVAVHWRPLKIKSALLIVECVRGHPPLFAGIAVKLLSNGRVPQESRERLRTSGWSFVKVPVVSPEFDTTRAKAVN